MEPLYYLEVVTSDGAIQAITELTLSEALDLIEEHADGATEFGLAPQ